MASKKVLGRGLGAFFPDYDEESSAKGEKKQEGDSSGTYLDPKKRVNIVLHIPVQNIRPNPHQPRKEFREDSLEELAGSIKKHGLIQPITVRYIGEKRFELISGERRLRATKLAGRKEIPAYIREVDDDEVISFALIENIQREDLNPIEVAMGYKRLVDELDYTQAEVAEKVGKNRTTVTNMLRLLTLPAFIQAGLRDEKISMGHARALISIEDPEDQEKIYKKAVKNDYSVRQIEKAVRSLAEEETTSGKTKKDDNSPFYNEISNRLRRRAGTAARAFRVDFLVFPCFFAGWCHCRVFLRVYPNQVIHLIPRNQFN